MIGYEARLKRCGINRLEDSRVRGDLIQVYKSVNGLNEIKWKNDPVNVSTERVLTRSNRLGIQKKSFKSKKS